MDEEERQHFEKLLQAYKRRLRPLEQQEAQTGPRTPPDILNEIEDVRKQISDVTSQLALAKNVNGIVPPIDNEFVSILNVDSITFVHTFGHEGLPQSFTCALHLHIENPRNRPILLQSISYILGLNDIFDPFLIKCIGIALSVSNPLKGTWSSNEDWRERVPSIRADLPLMIKRESEELLTVYVCLDARSYSLEDLVEAYHWVKELNVMLYCKISGYQVSKEEMIEISIDSAPLHEAFDETERRYKADRHKYEADRF